MTLSVSKSVMVNETCPPEFSGLFPKLNVDIAAWYFIRRYNVNSTGQIVNHPDNGH